jgi:hypothetical protein
VTFGNADTSPASRQQPACRERRRHAEREFALARLRPQRLHATRDPVEGFAKMLGGEMTVLGQFDLAACALEQRHAEELFEAANLVTDRRGRDVQFARGLCETQRA